MPHSQQFMSLRLALIISFSTDASDNQSMHVQNRAFPFTIYIGKYLVNRVWTQAFITLCPTTADAVNIALQQFNCYADVSWPQPNNSK